MDQLTEKCSVRRPSPDRAVKRTHPPRATTPAPVLPERVFAALPDGPKRYVAAKPLARFIPNVTKKVFQKQGFSSAALVADWSDIVGTSLAGQCLPERLKWPRATKTQADDAPPTRPTGATLTLRTDAAYALEIEYASAQILERINAYFGYRAITTLKIVQGPLVDRDDTNPSITPHRRPRHTDPDVALSVDAAISEIEDDGLKAALARMRKSVLTES